MKFGTGVGELGDFLLDPDYAVIFFSGKVRSSSTYYEFNSFNDLATFQ